MIILALWRVKLSVFLLGKCNPSCRAAGVDWGRIWSKLVKGVALSSDVWVTGVDDFGGAEDSTLAVVQGFCNTSVVAFPSVTRACLGVPVDSLARPAVGFRNASFVDFV
jgi:hypothetical protein